MATQGPFFNVGNEELLRRVNSQPSGSPAVKAERQELLSRGFSTKDLRRLHARVPQPPKSRIHGQKIFLVLFGLAVAGMVIEANKNPASTGVLAANIRFSRDVALSWAGKPNTIALLTTPELRDAVSDLSTMDSPDPQTVQWLRLARAEWGKRAYEEKGAVVMDAAKLMCPKSERRSTDRLKQAMAKHPEWGDDVLAAVTCHYVQIGMTPAQVRASWGDPEEVNRTILPGTVHEQWVYGNSYVYLEDGIVTAIQN